MVKNNHEKRRSIKGRSYKNWNLDVDLENVIAGQGAVSKLLLCFLAVLVCITLSTISGYIGEGILLHIFGGNKYRVTFILVLLITTVWQLFTLFSNFLEV
jgi:hypothetical protein